MVALSASTEAGFTDYDISLAAATGPPIAEAGFSITPLAPTYTLNSDGEAQTQQQDIVLLGGHTQTAFINMSQVALFSLPQESWTFLPVEQPGDLKTDLAPRQEVTEVEPRSGHTAVLSEDGSTVFLFGGWVGDVSTPAQPQMAILEFGSAYGGTGGWKWSIPEASSSSPLASGEGIYGHGAAMLPGGVMMIVGGYSTSSSASTKRQETSGESRTWLYNTTSKIWVNSYSPPPADAQASSNATNQSHAQAVGLGTGLGIGGALLLGVVAFYFWYSKRVKRAREDRGRALLSRSSDASFGGARIEHPFMQMDSGIDGRASDVSAPDHYWNVWDQTPGTYPMREPQMEQQTGSGTGLFLNVPSPTRGLRKGVAGKNYHYHAAPSYDEQRTSRLSGNIPPIAEREDEDDSMTGREREEETLVRAQQRLRAIERALAMEDPFADDAQELPNPLGSHPPSFENVGKETVRRVPTSANRLSAMPARKPIMNKGGEPNWTSYEDVPAQQPLLSVDTGRTSPIKSLEDRTVSTLSDKSQRTNSLTRTMSTRSGAILQAAMAARSTSDSSPEQYAASEAQTHPMSSTEGGRKSPYHWQSRARSSTAGSANQGPPLSASDGDSFTTANSTFADLQNQGEALLGGRLVADRDDPYQRAMAAHSNTRHGMPSVAFRNEPPQIAPLPPRRRQGWMGSLRRALNVVSMAGERSFSMTSNGTFRAPNEHDEQEPASAILPKSRSRLPIGSTPRRAASDGGALLRQKRGQKDWAEDNLFPRYRDDPDPGDWGEPARSSLDEQQAEEDWDVEDAANKRDVQVMFTIPKSRLRVVNATDTDRLSTRSASESQVSRSGSHRSISASAGAIRQQGSVRTLRAKFEGQSEKGSLPSTAEEAGTTAGEESRWEEKFCHVLSCLRVRKSDALPRMRMLKWCGRAAVQLADCYQKGALLPSTHFSAPTATEGRFHIPPGEGINIAKLNENELRQRCLTQEHNLIFYLVRIVPVSLLRNTVRLKFRISELSRIKRHGPIGGRVNLHVLHDLLRCEHPLRTRWWRCTATSKRVPSIIDDIGMVFRGKHDNGGSSGTDKDLTGCNIGEDRCSPFALLIWRLANVVGAICLSPLRAVIA
ncbi:hypothetical protein KC326_g115 [Hortaea werneckii]|nr:hypothetical protein KC326_g115 [Hortaea werneckii]